MNSERSWQPMRATFGAIVHAGGDDILDLDAGWVEWLFKKRGTILFRGFSIDVERFVEFSDRLGRGFRLHPGLGAHRSPVPGDPTHTVETAQWGHGPVAPHPELRWVPLTPELAWFFCENAPARGGQTLVYDGVEIIQVLPPAVRAQLDGRRVAYIYRAPPTFDWRKALGTADEREAGAILESYDNRRYGAELHYRFEDGNLHIRYTIPFFTPSRFHDELAFACSILSRGYGQSGVFEDGAIISQELKQTIASAVDTVGVEIAWQGGDLLMVDNTRVLHGRQAFDPGDDRRIYTRWGQVAFD